MASSSASQAAQLFLEMNYEKDSCILDLLADGSIGQILRQNGFSNIDALTDSDTVADALRTVNIYRNVYTSPVNGDTKLPLKDRTYEVIIAAGIFKEDGIEVQVIEQILRTVNSGGIICWSMGNPRSFNDNFDRYIEKLCDKCKWLSVLGYPRQIANYDNSDTSGFFYAMQVI